MDGVDFYQILNSSRVICQIDQLHQCLSVLYILHFTVSYMSSGASFQLFLGGTKKFFNATGLLKNWKKQHFICSNLTLFIVPFFLSFFLSSLIFLFFLFFLSFFSFILFPRGGATAPSPPQMTPLYVIF